jgi:hypothetical protein
MPVASKLNILPLHPETYIINHIDAYSESRTTGIYKMNTIINLQTTYSYLYLSFTACTATTSKKRMCKTFHTLYKYLYIYNHGF